MGVTTTRRPALGWALLATLASGFLYSQAFPTTAVRPLAWVALVPFLLVVRRAGARRAVGLGWVLMLALAYGVNDWFPRAVSRYYEQPASIGFAFFLGVTTFTAAPASMAFAWVYQRMARHPSLWLPWIAAAAWVAGELARTRLLGDPWVLFGYSQIGTDRLVQIADLTGVYGISFVLVAVNAAVAEVIDAAWQRPAAVPPMLASVAGTVVLVAAALLYGTQRLADLDAGGTATPHRVLLVQGDVDREAQWRSDQHGANLQRYLDLTRRALENGAAEASDGLLVVWPENAVTFFLDDEAEYRTAIGAMLEPHGATLVAGGPRSAQHDPAVYHNTAFLLTPDGRIEGWYDKLALLPFAEYFPMSWLDFMRRRFAQVREFTPGEPSPPLRTTAGHAGVIICNEALFAAPARHQVRAGAELLLTLANDSWVGETKYAAQAFDMAVLRAVEQRRYLLRASTSGPSAIVEPTGRIQARSGAATAATIAGAVAPRTGLTVYARVGDLFATVCAAGIVWRLAADSNGRSRIGA